MKTEIWSNCRQPVTNENLFCTECGSQIISTSKRSFGWRAGTISLALIFSICAVFSSASSIATETGQAEPQSAAPAQISAFATTPKQQEKEVTVFVTDTGSKYHRGSCQYLHQSKIPMSLKDAKRNYLPCAVCHPAH